MTGGAGAAGPTRLALAGGAPVMLRGGAGPCDDDDEGGCAEEEEEDAPSLEDEHRAGSFLTSVR